MVRDELKKLSVVVIGGGWSDERDISRSSARECRAALQEAGFAVYSHHRVSTCDEGIALGQLAIAAAKRRL